MTEVDMEHMQELFVKMIDRIGQLETEVERLRVSTQRLIPKGDVYIGRV